MPRPRAWIRAHRYTCMIAGAGLLVACAGKPATETSESTAPTESVESSEATAPEARGETEPGQPETAALKNGQLQREALRRATRNGSASYLISQLKPEVHRPRGKFGGWRIGTVFPDDPELCPDGCAIQAGDIVLTVNGSPIERPEQLSTLLEGLESLNELNILLRRGTQLIRLRYQISDS